MEERNAIGGRLLATGNPASNCGCLVRESKRPWAPPNVTWSQGNKDRTEDRCDQHCHKLRPQKWPYFEGGGWHCGG